MTIAIIIVICLALYPHVRAGLGLVILDLATITAYSIAGLMRLYKKIFRP